MDFQPFIEKYYSSLPEDKMKSVKAFCKNAASVFGGNDLRDVCNNKTAIYSLFYISGDCVGKSQFFKVKGYVKNLYDWFLGSGITNQETMDFISKLTLGDVISDGELSICYFPDLDDALSFVGVIGERCGLNSSDDLLNIKAMIILAWHGLTVEDMRSVLKTDLRSDDYVLTVRDIGSGTTRSIPLDKKYFDLLWRFSVLDKHAGFPGGKTQFYKDSPYLMRSARQERMESNNIVCAFKRFNEISADFGKRLNFAALRKNGLFCKVLENESNYKTASLAIKALANCDKGFAFGYKFSYNKWKDIYAKESR